MTFHIRINSLFVLLWLTDFTMFAFAVETTLNHGVGGTVLFASEVGCNMVLELGGLIVVSIVCDPDGQRAQLRGQICLIVY
jgi:E3 ubiquitin-protein ligase synoviolin